jgi:hypothetical protein
MVRGLRPAAPGLSLWLSDLKIEAHVQGCGTFVACDEMWTCDPGRDGHGDGPEARDEIVIAPGSNDQLEHWR